ncbi:MAG: 30S ribosomal protein S16 [Armatimonadetes bacterium]|nr:30S ribosomal protein S16 [Armatimonadota bacterium]
MVKIRLARLGNKHRPFYRVVVAKNLAGRNGAFIEILGTFNPLMKKEGAINLKKERALHWLMNGAQPTETAAILLKKAGILEEFFAQRPAAKKNFKFLDKRTEAISVPATVAAPAVEAAPAPAPVVEDAPVAEAPATEEAAPSEAPAEA